MKKVILSLFLIGSFALVSSCGYSGCGGNRCYKVKNTCCNTCSSCSYGYGYSDWWY